MQKFYKYMLCLIFKTVNIFTGYKPPLFNTIQNVKDNFLFSADSFEPAKHLTGELEIYDVISHKKQRAAYAVRCFLLLVPTLSAQNTEFAVYALRLRRAQCEY